MSRSGVLDPPFLTSEAEGNEWSASRLGRLISGNRALGTHWIKGLVGHRGCLDVMKRKISHPCQESNQVCPAVASHYNDWAKYAVLLQKRFLLFPVTFWHLCTFVKAKINLAPCFITHPSATNLKSGTQVLARNFCAGRSVVIGSSTIQSDPESERIKSVSNNIWTQRGLKI